MQGKPPPWNLEQQSCLYREKQVLFTWSSSCWSHTPVGTHKKAFWWVVGDCGRAWEWDISDYYTLRDMPTHCGLYLESPMRFSGWKMEKDFLMALAERFTLQLTLWFEQNRPTYRYIFFFNKYILQCYIILSGWICECGTTDVEGLL